MVYFHGAIAVLLLVNLILFLQSAYSLLVGVWAGASDTGSAVTTSSPSRLNSQMMWIVFELFMVMGLLWIFEVS